MRDHTHEIYNQQLRNIPSPSQYVSVMVYAENPQIENP